MWPFRQKTVRVEMKMDIALTADGRPPSDYRECYVCHRLVNSFHAKVVEMVINRMDAKVVGMITGRIDTEPSHTKAWYCLECAPEWDVVMRRDWGDHRTSYYNRVPAMPETFEEINRPEEAPQPPGENVNMSGPDSGATLKPTSEERTVRIALESIQTEGLEALARLRAQSKAEPRGKAKARAGVEARAKAKGEARVKARAANFTALEAWIDKAAAEGIDKATAEGMAKALSKAKKPTK